MSRPGKFPEYSRLFSNSVLNATIAVGYDEGGAHESEIRQLVRGLATRSYTPFNPGSATSAQYKAAGLDPKTVDPDLYYFVKSLTYDGKPVKVVLEFITADTPRAKDKFARALAHNELVIYSGHGRYGSGPDFDDKHSKSGNFVIGRPYAKGKVSIGSNDLAKAKMTKDYQLLFFDGCSTKYYVDDLRKLPKNKSTKNLDIIGATTELPWATSAEDVLSFLDGVTGFKRFADILSDLESNNREGSHDTRKYFFSDGVRDNPTTAGP
jgi:hypothetical protein